MSGVHALTLATTWAELKQVQVALRSENQCPSQACRSCWEARAAGPAAEELGQQGQPGFCPPPAEVQAACEGMPWGQAQCGGRYLHMPRVGLQLDLFSTDHLHTAIQVRQP